MYFSINWQANMQLFCNNLSYLHVTNNASLKSFEVMGFHNVKLQMISFTITNFILITYKGWKLKNFPTFWRLNFFILTIFFSRESDSTITNVCQSVSQSQKPLNSLKSSSFIIHSSSFFIILPSFRNFQAFQLVVQYLSPFFLLIV